MDIKLYEGKKVLTSPILIVLAIVFIIFNGMFIYNKSYIRGDLKMVNKLIKEYGSEINEDMLKVMDTDYNKKLAKLNEITKVRFNKEFQSIDDFLDSSEYLEGIYYEPKFSEEELQLISELTMLNLYVEVSMDFIKDYETIDIMEMAEGTIKFHGISGKAADIARDSYRELVPRFEELKSNGEYKNMFPVGKIYRTQFLLFKEVFMKCFIEVMILTVLAVSLLVNYERDNKTISLVSTTKRGRNLIKDKLLVAICSTFVITTIIFGITLLVYFMVFDYGEICNVSVSSALNWEISPYICWFNLNFKEYFILSIVVVFVISVIFAGIAFVISCLLKSSYKSFFIFFIVFGAIFIIPSIFSKSSSFLHFSYYNVFILALNPHTWFMEAGVFMTAKNYELMTLLTNGIIVMILGALSIRRFKREEIA